jgi:hypothetical protein
MPRWLVKLINIPRRDMARCVKINFLSLCLSVVLLNSHSKCLARKKHISRLFYILSRTKIVYYNKKTWMLIICPLSL